MKRTTTRPRELRSLGVSNHADVSILPEDERDFERAFYAHREPTGHVHPDGRIHLFRGASENLVVEILSHESVHLAISDVADYETGLKLHGIKNGDIFTGMDTP